MDDVETAQGVDADPLGGIAAVGEHLWVNAEVMPRFSANFSTSPKRYSLNLRTACLRFASLLQILRPYLSYVFHS